MGRFCIVEELLSCSLSRLLSISLKDAGASLKFISRCARDILEVLSEIHHKGWIHADVKPSNILWDPTESCWKLTDFGLAIPKGEVSDNAALHVQSPGYRAPEVIRVAEMIRSGASVSSRLAFDSGIDLFSLGITLLELYLGRHLWTSTSDKDVSDFLRLSDINNNDRSDMWHEIIISKQQTTSQSSKELRIEWFVDFIQKLLQTSPERRITANEALSHDFITHLATPPEYDALELVVLPSSILRIPNVCTLAELTTEEDDIKEDLKEGIQSSLNEAMAMMMVPSSARIGRIVLRLLNDHGAVFVKIEGGNWLQMEHIHKALFGRWFGENMLVPTYFPEEHWNHTMLY
eukprot:TRINITY_DN9959_c0_g1_i1.p1 TRINITY_DN9959_c0_g1~~TRINITY_DN9959_c0_g1_i1.p1  ORF type:complete len:348 (+),score=38.51 TRINITY_DN9959_c0_g1_i1:292-1335(+)